MKGAHTHFPRERREGYPIVDVLREILARARHGSIDRPRLGARRPTPFARAIARALGVRRRVEELDSRARRPARRTRRPAEDPRGAHGVDEASIESAVALL